MTFAQFLDAHFTGLLSLAFGVLVTIVACHFIQAASNN